MKSHIFKRCKKVSSIRTECNVSPNWHIALRIDNDLINTVKFLDKIFQLPCVKKHGW